METSYTNRYGGDAGTHDHTHNHQGHSAHTHHHYNHDNPNRHDDAAEHHPHFYFDPVLAEQQHSRPPDDTIRTTMVGWHAARIIQSHVVWERD